MHSYDSLVWLIYPVRVLVLVSSSFSFKYTSFNGFRKQTLYLNYLKIYYLYYVYTIWKNTLIVLVVMGSLVPLIVSPVREDPLTSIWQMILTCHLRIFLPLNTSILGIVNLWLLHFVGTALFFEYWDTVWNTTIIETVNVGSSDCDYLWIHCIHTSSGPRLWTSRRKPSHHVHCKNWLLDIRVGQPLETDLGLSLCVNPRIQTSPGTLSKIDAIVRYILLIFSWIFFHSIIIKLIRDKVLICYTI